METARGWAQRMVANSPTWSEEKWLRVEQILGVKFISSANVGGAIEACEVDSTPVILWPPE